MCAQERGWGRRPRVFPRATPKGFGGTQITLAHCNIVGSDPLKRFQADMPRRFAPRSDFGPFPPRSRPWDQRLRARPPLCFFCTLPNPSGTDSLLPIRSAGAACVRRAPVGMASRRVIRRRSPPATRLEATRASPDPLPSPLPARQSYIDGRGARSIFPSLFDL